MAHRPPSIMAQRKAAADAAVVTVEQPAQPPRRLPRRRDPHSLTASAALLTRGSTSKAKIKTEEWQTEAWNFYDDIGELRAGVNWLANALSRVNLIAAIPPAAQGDEPTAIDLEKDPQYKRHVELVSEIGGGPSGQGQLLAGCAKQITVGGLGYIWARAGQALDEFVEWRTLSSDEARRQGDTIEVRDAETGEWIVVQENDLLIKCWRSHPRRSWEPDSAVRAARMPLLEIKRLSQRVIADAESRLAGNGILILPTEAEFPPGQGTQTSADKNTDEDSGDDFVEAMVEISSVSMADQGSAAARVPLVARIPGEFIEKAQWIELWSKMDEQLIGMREAAIRRLALALDMPPEVLLGMAEANHWTGWQIEESAITLHIEPLAELIVHAITVGFYKAALKAEGLDENSAIVWYDTTDLTTRPDLTKAALEAHDRLLISNDALLRYLGLETEDYPSDEEFRQRVLLQVAQGAPTLAPAMLAAAGILDPVVADAASSAAPADPNAAPPPADGQPAADPRPIPDRTPAEPAAAALIAAADGLVVRALELAGRRLRGAAGKGKPGGAEAVECDDPTLLHTRIAATEHASLEHLLDGVWDRAGAVAERHGVDPDSLRAFLDGYTRALLASGYAHDYDRLTQAIGVFDAVPVG